MVNFLNLIPNELIVRICESVDNKTRRQLSMVDHRMQNFVLSLIQSIRFFPPIYYSCQNYPSDILVSILCRHPNLQKILFCQENWRDATQFGLKEEPYIRSLVSFLKSVPNNVHPLNTVKEIRYQEIIGESSKDSLELNNLFLQSLGHQGLKKFKIEIPSESVLTNAAIQTVLDNSPNLETFIFDGGMSTHNVALSFVNQPKLSKVKLIDWETSASTLNSLQACSRLKELVIRNKSATPWEITTVFIGKHFLDLTCLHLGKVIPLQNDEQLNCITKKLPNLTDLKFEDDLLKNISDDGMGRLGKNCTNLKNLRIGGDGLCLSNSKLDSLTKNLPHLELTTIKCACKISHIGIIALARNCKNLRYLNVSYHRKIKASGIEALIENCQKLQVILFRDGVRVEDIVKLSQKLPNCHILVLNQNQTFTTKKNPFFYL